MRERRAYWAAPFLLALVACESPDEALDVGSGATIETVMGCLNAGEGALSQTVLEVAASQGKEGAQYCSDRGTYILVTRSLSNGCYPNGRRTCQSLPD